MMNRADPAPAELAALIEDQLGIQGDARDNSDWLEILRQRLGATASASFEAYQQLFSSPLSRQQEVAQLARAVTVGETYFFRDSRQFEALTTVVLPEIFSRRAPEAPIQILSAACSTGEEPYSMAIAARELLGARASRIRIQAFDINPAAIELATQARYSEWSLRATPEALKQRYFTRRGSQYELLPAVREAVTFETRNLFDQEPPGAKQTRFDVILCRNALIYFSRRKVALALQRLSDALAADGVLFLGSAETPRGFEDRLVPQEVCGSFCYRLTDNRLSTAAASGQPNRVASARNEPSPVPPEPSVQSASEFALSDGVWVAAIEAATRRLADLVTPTSTRASPEPAGRRVDWSATLIEARSLITRERFSEALSKLDELVSSGSRSSQVELLRASILTNQGRFVESTDVCRRVLDEQPHSAGAYHLLGVASEQLGRLDEARRCHEMAITLDANFAMSHWLLGRLCLNSGLR